MNPASMRLAPYLFVLLWSTGYIGSKLGAPYAEPFTFLSLRFAIVLAILLVLALAAGQFAIWPPRAHRSALAGGLLHGIYLGGVFFAIDQGMPAGIAALVVCLQPLLTALLAGPLLGERVTSRQWLGIGLGLVGAALTLSPRLALTQAGLPGSPGGDITVATLAATVLALLAITLGTLYQKARCGNVPLRDALIPQYVGALIVTGLAAGLTETREVIWSLEFLFALAWLSIVLSLGAIALLMLLIRHSAATVATRVFYLVPAVTALIAWALFGEQLLLVQIVGMGIVCAAVALMVPPQTR